MSKEKCRTKMYILVKKSLPSHKAIAIAHGVLMCYLKFQFEKDMLIWRDESFRKVVCEVTDEDFEIAKKIENNVIVTESGLAGIEVAVVFCPRDVWPELMKKYPLMNV